MKTRNLFEVAEVNLTYRPKIILSEQPQVKNSNSAYIILLHAWGDKIEFVEEFNVLLLSRSSHVLGITNISKGGIAGTVVDARIIFSAAVKACASSIILAHNHPSGNLSPSQADIDITRKLKEGGTYLDINVADHLIVTPHGYCSFADEGII